MKTLIESLNETLEDSLRLEITKILSDEQQEIENKTSEEETSN